MDIYNRTCRRLRHQPAFVCGEVQPLPVEKYFFARIETESDVFGRHRVCYRVESILKIEINCNVIEL